MKKALVTTIFLLTGLAAAPALAGQLPAPPAARSLYTCSGQALSRVAYDAAEPVAPCCEGMLACPRLLGSAGFERPRQDNRT